MVEAPVGVRIAVGWAVGLAAIVVSWGLADARKGPSGAAAGAGREFVVLLLVAIPLVAGAGWLAQVRRENTVASVALPSVLGLLVAAVVWWAGFVPEQSLGCAAVGAFGIDLPASCVTSAATRVRALAEGLAAWAGFGLAAAAWRWLLRAGSAPSHDGRLDPHVT